MTRNFDLIVVGSGLAGLYAALLASHFPPADVSLDLLNSFSTPAQQRLIFEEAFLFQTGVAARKNLRCLRKLATNRG